MNLLHNTWMIMLTLVGMEVVSWILHKYIFHGPLWFIHKTHHARTIHSSLELNDVFSLIFALISITFFYVGWVTPSPLQLDIGVGIALYGLVYFVVHDGLIHQRYPYCGSRTSNTYLKQIQRAHQRHHVHPDKAPSEEFGLFLVISRKYWRDMFAT